MDWRDLVGRPLSRTAKDLSASATVRLGRALRSRRLEREILDRAGALPLSGGGRFFRPWPYRVGIVSDPFLFQDYQRTCDLRAVGPDAGDAELEGLDLLLVTSVWHGLHGEWTGAWKEGGPANVRLRRIRERCAEMGIPVVFWSKEDPPNWEKFAGLAEGADQIFTTDEGSVGRYRARSPGTPVDRLDFGVDPAIWSPMGLGTGRDEGAAVFAGSWMPRYPERTASQEELFRMVLDAGLRLHILDRNSERGIPRYCYPLRYQRRVVPCVDRRLLGNVYKTHGWVLNVNSVRDSGSMFSGRAYDALACGCTVLSGPSVGMERRFPEVFVLRGPEDLDAALRMGAEERYVRAMGASLRIMGEDTSYHRMGRILTSVGLSCPPQGRRIAVLLTGDDRDDPALEEMFRRQTWPDKVLVRVDGDPPELGDVDLIAVWERGCQYGPRYLEAMAAATKYTRCRYVTKHVYRRQGRLTGGREQVRVDEIRDRRCTLFWNGCFTAAEILSMPRTSEARDGWSADHLHYEADP